MIRVTTGPTLFVVQRLVFQKVQIHHLHMRIKQRYIHTYIYIHVYVCTVIIYE